MNDTTTPPQAEFIDIAVTNGIATIRLNRPDVRNAINDQMRIDLITAFDWANGAEDVKGVILTGAGKGFCSGGDVSGMRARLDAPAGEVAFKGWSRQRQTHRSISVIHNLSKPVVAAINGAAFGLGLDMALACDFIIVADGAKMSMSFTKRGLVSDGGGMYFLPRRVGLPMAKELIFTAKILEAAEAKTIGLVDRVATPDTLQDAAQSWCEELSQGSAASIALTKSILDRTFETSEEQVFALGREAQAICYTSAEHRASVEAFLAK